MNKKKFNTENIRNVMMAFLREEGLETPLLEFRLIQSWPKVMGSEIMRYTGEVKIQQGVLLVKIMSASLRQNLQTQHKIIAQKLNNYVGGPIISDVHFI